MISPELQNHWLWQDKPFAKGQAWIDLLLLAESESVFFRSKVYHLPKGHVVTSENELANRWGWSRTKARNFIRMLSACSLIKIKSGENTLITINETFNQTTKEQHLEQDEIQEKEQGKKQFKPQVIKGFKEELEQVKEQEEKQEKYKNATEYSTKIAPTYRQKTLFDAITEKNNEEEKQIQ